MAGGVRAVPQDAEAWERREVRPWPAWMAEVRPFEDAEVPALDAAHVRLVRPAGARSGVGTSAAVCVEHVWAGV